MRKDKTLRGASKRKHFKSGFFIFLMLLTALTLPVALKGQNEEIKFERISIGQGLNQGTISCIYQDNRGFMWFGTQHGLHRYDGYLCKTYEYDPRDPNSLSHNLVRSICEADSGCLWIGTLGGGLNKFNLKTGKFTVFQTDPGNPYSLSNNNVTAIIDDGSETLWIGTYKGLNRFDTGKKKFSHCLRNSRINTICLDSSDILWVGTNKGIYRSTNLEKNNFERFSCQKEPAESGYKKIRAILEEKPGVLWFGAEDGVFRFTSNNEEYIHDMNITDKFAKKKCDKPVTVIFRDNSGIIWIGTMGNGLYIFDNKNSEFIHHKYDDNNPDSLSHDNVLSIFQNRTGLIWIGTGGGGFNKFDPSRQKFELHKNIPGNYNSLSHNEVRGIYEGQDGEIWIGTAGGVNRFDPIAKEFFHYRIRRNVSTNLNRNIISAVCEDHEGVLWVGTNRAGMYILKKGQTGFERYTDKYIKKDDYILTIYEDKSDTLWIGTEEKGLIRINKDRKKKTKNFIYNSLDKNSISDNRIYAIVADKIDKNILWIGTGSGGLNKFDKKIGTFTRFLPKPDDPGSLSHNIVASLLVDTNGILWVGTGGKGLNKFDREAGTFKVYTKENGLPDNVIYAILEDGDNNLWLSTNNGLSKFDPEKKEFRNYTIRDGLQSYEFNRGAALGSKDGKMYFGGFKGFNIVNTKIIKRKERQNPPPIVITSYKKYDKDKPLTTFITEINELKLSYKDKSVSFEFAALSFADPGSNQYAYKLEPVDKEWKKLGNKHDVDLINLKPGKYTFMVKGSNNDGVWNEEGTSIKIKIKPPFRQTWYYYTLLAIFISSTIVGLVRWRINIIEKANKQLKKEIEERKKARALYKKLVETSPDAITLSDVETKKIIMANQWAVDLLGYSSEKEMQENIESIYDIFAPNNVTKAKKNAENIRDKGVNRNTEYTLLSKDGRLIDVEMSTSLVKDADKKPRYFLSITRDISERKESERKEKLEREKMVQIDKMVSLGQLVSGVAHELNNPLASIKLNADSFSKVWKDVAPVLDQHYKKNQDFSLAKVPYKLSKPRFQNLITGLIESGLRIEKIINTLKEFSRPGDASARQSIDINKVIESSIKLTGNMIKKSTNSFSFKPAGNLPSIEGNFQRLEQVFINFIQNACQALSDKIKKIEIVTHFQKKNKQIEVRVEDEGKGIAEKDQKHIMDLFFTTKRESGGTGIGLAISSQIIREHGGRIGVSSKVGQGTIVTIKLPV